MAKDAKPLSRVEKSRLMLIGLNIRRYRERKGLTLEESEELGYPSWKHLQGIESGRKNLTITSLFRIAKVLEVHATELIKGIE